MVLCAATLFLYWPALRYPLHFDDLEFFAAPDRIRRATFALDPRWVTYATFYLTSLFAKGDWFWYRLGNVVLHALTAWLLFHFFQRLFTIMLDDVRRQPSPRWLAAAGALLFALHPIAVYDVVYVTQRSTLMATLLSVAALTCYLEGLERRRAAWFAGAAVCYVLAVFSKEHSIMLPGVAAVLTVVVRPSSLATFKTWLVPAGALVLIVGGVALWQRHNVFGIAYEFYGADMLAQLSRAHGAPGVEAHPFALSTMTQGFLFFKYLLLWIVPNVGWMSVDMREPFAERFFIWPQTVGFVAFIAYPLCAWLLLRRGRGTSALAGFGLLAPWILFLPELSTVRIEQIFVLYRSYLWMWALIALLPALGSAMRPAWRNTSVAAACLVLALLARNRIATFESHFALWDDAVRHRSDRTAVGVDRAYVNRGTALAEMGRPSDALADYDKAITINPEIAGTYVNRGGMDSALGRHTEAIADFDAALRLDNNLPSAYVNRGVEYLRLGRLDEAAADLTKAIELNPRHAGALANRGLVYIRAGRLPEALRDLDASIALKADDADSRLWRGVVELRLERSDAALADFTGAIALDPTAANAYGNRGALHLDAGRVAEAVTDLSRAIALNPRYANAYVNRAEAYRRLARDEEARRDLAAACRLGVQDACR